MIKTRYIIAKNTPLAKSIFLMRLLGDTSAITAPGQFIAISVDGLYLRRPFSVCDWGDGWLHIIYKVVGAGTKRMSKMGTGTRLDTLSGLGNGFDTAKCPSNTALIGGGVGIPPMYGLAKRLRAEGKEVSVVLGYGSAREVFFTEEFRALGCKTTVTTVDGSFGEKGVVTDALPKLNADFFCACGPEPMLQSLAETTEMPGLLSFEERMGCGFGACMGCSCETKYGYKRICKEGPVMEKEEIIW